MFRDGGTSYTAPGDYSTLFRGGGASGDREEASRTGKSMKRDGNNCISRRDAVCFSPLVTSGTAIVGGECSCQGVARQRCNGARGGAGGPFPTKRKRVEIIQ